MPSRFLLILFALMFAKVHLHAQDDPYNYFSLHDAYELNFPTLGFSMKLPGGVQVKFPLLEDDEGSLRLYDTHFNCFLNDKLLDESFARLSFALPDMVGKRAMTFQLNRLTHNPDNFLRNSSECRSLPAITTELGTFNVYELTKKDGSSTRIYVYSENSLLYMFEVVVEKPEEVEQCEAIIQSCYKKQMIDELIEYREEQAKAKESSASNADPNGLLQKADTDDTDPVNVFKKEPSQIKLTTSAPTVFNYTSLGFQIMVPENFECSVLADDVLRYGDRAEVVLSENDFRSNGSSNWRFSKDELHVALSFVTDPIDVDEAIELMASSQKEIKRFKLHIDGVLFKAIALVSDDLPSICAVGNLNGYGLKIEFLLVDQGSLPVVEQMLQSVSLANSRKQGFELKNPKRVKPISKQLSIPAFEDVPLKPTVFTQPTVKQHEFNAYSFVEERFRCKMPTGMETYLNPNNAQQVTTSTEIQLRRAEGGPDDETLSLMLMGDDGDNTTSSKSSIFNIFTTKSEVSAKDNINVLVKMWSTFNHIEVRQTAKGMVNGKEWMLMYYLQMGEPIYWFITKHNGYFVNFTCSKGRDRAMYEGMLYSFEFE